MCYYTIRERITFINLLQFKTKGAKNMKKFDVCGLNEKQYRKKYLNLCDKYNDVNQEHVIMSWANGLYYGYLLASEKI